MKRKALITGAYGFLGINTSKYFKLKGFHVVGIGRYRKTSINEISHFDQLIAANVTLNSLMKVNQKFDVIIHCAGSGSVEQSFIKPYQDFENSVSTTTSVLEYIRLQNIRASLIYPSSVAVYGNIYKSVKENHASSPISPYGYHKMLCEKLCAEYSQIYKIAIKIIRFFSIYGPGLKKQVIWDLSNKICSKKENTLKIRGTGNEKRDFIYIDDAVRLIHLLSLENSNFDTINCGTGKSYKISKLAQLIKKNFMSKKKIIFTGLKPKNLIDYNCANIDRAMQYGWEPEIQLSEGINKYVKWFNENKND